MFCSLETGYFPIAKGFSHLNRRISLRGVDFHSQLSVKIRIKTKKICYEPKILTQGLGIYYDSFYCYLL